MHLNVERLRTVDAVIERWPFFQEGLKKLNTILREDKQIDEVTFLRVILDTVGRHKEDGHVAIYSSGGERLGFTVAFPSNSPYHKPTVVVYAAYSRKTLGGASRAAMLHIEKWARSRGFKEIHAFSPRFNGKGFALFEKRFGYRRHLILFTKEL